MWYSGGKVRRKESERKMEKGRREIGSFFKGLIGKRRIDRGKLAMRLGFDYADNERMICAYFVKEDRLWRESEVERWCGVLGIGENSPKYDELMARAGRKDISG